MSGSPPTTATTSKHLALSGLHLVAYHLSLSPYTKSELGRCAVHLRAKRNLLSALVYLFPKAHFRTVILKEVQITLLLPHLQTVLLFLKTVLANCFCNSFSTSDHQNILGLEFRKGFLCFPCDSSGRFTWSYPDHQPSDFWLRHKLNCSPSS